MSSFLQKKRLVWSLALVCLCAVAAVFYAQGRRYIDSIEAVEHSLEVQQSIDETLSVLKDVETGARGYLLTGDERFLSPFNAAKQDLAGSVAKLRQLVRDDPAQEGRVDRIAALADQKLEQSDRNIRLYRSGHADQAVAAVRAGDGRRTMDKIRALVDAMKVDEAHRLDARSSAARRTQVEASIAAIGGLALAFAFVAFGLVTVARDVRAVRRASERLAESEERFHRLADATFEAVAIVDGDRVRDVNAAFVELFGYAPRDVKHLRPTDLVEPEGRDALAAQLAGDETTTREYAAERRDGTRFAGELRVRRGLVVVRDVTEQKRIEAELAELSLRDALTGLFNRRGLLELGQQMLRLAARERRWVAVHFVDLNGLKAINDELGHKEGDRAIAEAAELLRSTARESDVVARLGGDELVVLAADTSPELAEHFRAQLREQVRAVNDAGGRRYRLSFSIGTAYFDPGAPASIEQLLAQADALMYDAKQERRRMGSPSLAPPRQ